MTDRAAISESVDHCAREPIRIPGAIQPHGALAVLRDDDLAIVQASANLDAQLGWQLGGKTMPVLESLGAEAALLAQAVRRWRQGEDALYSGHHSFGGREFEVSAHSVAQGVILEFERPAGRSDDRDANFYPLMRRFLDSTEGLASVAELCQQAARQFQELTGFSRVMVYRFDADWNGTVIAEHGDGALPSYLDLRFPASDIPAQARELYRLSRLRLIPTTSYQPVPLEPPLCPIDGAPLDLSQAVLRSVSPVHLEYMRNMGTAASMSASLLVDGKLWGLVACHHPSERHVDPHRRAACDFLARIVAQQIGARERTAETDERLRLKRIETELVAHLARAKSFQAGLVELAPQWLAVTDSAGAAVISDGIALTAGETPSIDAILELASWIHGRRPDQVYDTDCLSDEWPAGETIADVASGILAVPISRLHPSFIIWFRPEVVRTVTWGGDPGPAKQIDAAGRLHPRLSFESWKQTVRLRAQPWRRAEILSAGDFRGAVIDFVLQHAEERAQLTEELQRTNKELEAFSYSISHDLRAPFRHIVGYAQLLGEEEADLKQVSRHYLESIARAALSAGELVDDLLRFSQLGRATLRMSRIDMRKIADEIRQSVAADMQGRPVSWEIGQMPPCWGDATLVRQALFNLVDNAVKYSSQQELGRVRISGVERADDVLYSVEDNGVGFDMAYVGKLFQVFQRLHRVEEFEGSGIGLALTKRIIDRHGGTIEARGAIGSGAKFSFSLPKTGKEETRVDA